MSELKVPTVALPAQVTCTDGRSFSGRIFVPAAASHHSGPMLPEEWVNEPSAFFPFLPDQADTSVILNKEAVLIISTVAVPEEDEVEPHAPGQDRRVAVECGDRRVEGEVLIDMPAGRKRVLDVLNLPQGFLTVREGDRRHFVHKRHITRIFELRDS